MIFVYLDNCAVTLGQILRIVQRNQNAPDLRRRLLHYITTQAANDMVIYGRAADRAVAKLLRQELNHNLPQSFWDEVHRYYLEKYREGCSVPADTMEKVKVPRDAWVS
jgi:hypothetical protein